MIRNDMSVPGHGNAAPVQDALFFRKPDILRGIGIDFILMRMTMPVCMNGTEIVLRFLVNLKHIARALIKFIEFFDYPVDGVFRKDRRRKIPACLIAEDKRIRFDIDGHVRKGMRKCLCLAKNVWFALCHLK